MNPERLRRMVRHADRVATDNVTGNEDGASLESG